MAYTPHAVNFEAYETPPVPASSSFCVHPTPAANRDIEDHQSDQVFSRSFASHSITLTPEIDPEATSLSLDSLQRKWGKTIQSSPATSEASFDRDRSIDGSDRICSQARESSAFNETTSVERRKYQHDVSYEKQKLAVSLFGSGLSSREASAKSSGSALKPKATLYKSHPASGGARERTMDNSNSGQNYASPVEGLFDLTDGMQAGLAPSKDPFREDLLNIQPVATVVKSSSQMLNDGVVNFRVSKNNLPRVTSGGNYSFPPPSLCNVSWFSKGGVGIVLMALVTILLYLLIRWGRAGESDEHLQYAIVIDCGSTGTRLQFYGWAHRVMPGQDSFPVMVHPGPLSLPGVNRNDAAPSHEKLKQQRVSRAYKRMETEPGLDKLLHNETGVKNAILPLLDWAGTQVPQPAHGRTPVFFLATAGLRRLPLEHSGWLLEKAWSILEMSTFMCRREWVRIISGQEEAYYGWIALNYNLGRLGHRSSQGTVGALDLGGSSLEVTFEPMEAPKAEYGVNVSIGSKDHHLYAYSHPGFGLNDAFEKSVSLLLKQSHPSVESRGGIVQLPHPCLQAGYKQPYVCSSHCLLPLATDVGEPDWDRHSMVNEQELRPQVELIGKPNWAACQLLAQSVINTSGSSGNSVGTSCDSSPCALGRHQPQPQGQFYGLAGFFVVYKFFGLTSSESLDELLLKAQQFCSLSWQDVEETVDPQPSVDRYCFRAPYVIGLLRQGLHLSDDQIVIGSGDFAWTLGAALQEAGALLPKSRGGQGENELVRLRPAPYLDLHFLTVLIVVLLAIIVLVVTLYKRGTYSQLWRRSYLPLFVPSGGNVSSSGWLPLSVRSQIRLGINVSGAPGRMGDGRVKLPHSPSPTALNHSFHNQILELGEKPAGGDGPVLECDVLQQPNAGGTTNSGIRAQVQLSSAKMQQKGGSRLQSRRTQSREDLSAYLSDNHVSKVRFPKFVPAEHV